MLQPADLEVIARDPALPGLALTLDAAAVAEVLGVPVEPFHLRYKPGTSCMATFRTASGFVTLRALTRARFDADEMSPRRAALSKRLPEHAVIVMPPEADKRITALRRGALPAGAVPLRYKPERRMVLRDGDAMIKAMSKATWDRARIGATFGAAVGGPAVLSLDEASGMIATQWLHGAAADAMPDTHEAIGAALAALHRSRADLPALPQSRPPPALDDLESLAPDLGERIRRLRGMLDLLLHNAAQVPCHGDFSADQVMLTQGRIAFVDWDEAGMGDPARDIGSFLARIDHDRLTGKPGDGAAFLDGYGALPQNLAVHHAAALAALATEGFRTRAPDWHGLASRLLSRAEEILPSTMQIATDPRTMARISGHPIASARLIRSKPGRRALLRYDMPGGALIGKLRVKGPDARTPRLHARLRQAGLDGSGDTGVTAVRGDLPRMHLWLQDLAPGAVLADFVAPDACRTPFHDTGRSLARLHSSGVPADRDWSMADEADVLRRTLEGIPTAQALCQRLCNAPLAPERATIIHRDFYPDQVLVDEGRIWLLDLDLCANGLPSIDLGNFLAHLDEFALRSGWEVASLNPLSKAFLDGYSSLRPVPENTAHMRDMSLARHIGLAQRFPDRSHTPQAIMDLVERRLKVNEFG
ncbi:phosphotransferase [Cereibacter sp. SYSU M97828]|nr:phosphotransferase [Cereibacter flavus]